MYSIPDYSLRFAAHCRARLNHLEHGTHDVTRGAAANAARFWTRFPAQAPGADPIRERSVHRIRIVTP